MLRSFLDIRWSHDHVPFLACPLVAFVAFLWIVPARAGEQSEFTKSTLVYKTIEAVEVHADVYRIDDARRRPVLLWIHGGALIFGSREMVPTDVVNLCRDEGFVLVSIDYRLAPEAKLEFIEEDIVDAVKWVRERGPELFGAEAGTLVVAGNSAGGYLALLTGSFRPPVTAIASYWGYGDVEGAWATQPSPSHITNIPPISREDAMGAISENVLTHKAWDRPRDANARVRYYIYLRQNGLWMDEVSGGVPLETVSPLHRVDGQHPPTLLIHGAADPDVPVEESITMAERLREHGVTCSLIIVQGAGHELEGGSSRDVKATRGLALSFMRSYLSGVKE